MTTIWVKPDTVATIAEHFDAELIRAQGVLDFPALAAIAWGVIWGHGALGQACRAAAARAMDNVADYDTAIECYAEVAFAAIERVANGRGIRFVGI